ncbi:MAG: hypothetical protein RLZZ371_1054 [Pseudomonadota bacterium]
MNLIASCPACHTSYKLVHDQLRISDGWVRCGQCSEVFDASQHLIEAGAEDPVAPVPAPEDDFVQTLQLMPDQIAGIDPHAASAEAANAKPQVLPANEVPWVTAALLIKPSSDHESEPEPSGLAAPDLKPVAEPVSFMQEQTGWSSRLTRGRSVFWWALGGLLLLGLVLQVLYREREWMAARFPDLKPALKAACELMGCRLSLLQRIEHLEIDSATFQQVGPDIFELRFVVRNKAAYAQALPAVELSLTDLADQPVLRRVFTPLDLGAKLESIAPSGDWSATAYLRVRADAPGGRAQGYRVLIFYP